MDYTPKKHIKSVMRTRPFYSMPVLSDDETTLTIEDNATCSVTSFLSDILRSQTTASSPTKTIVTVKAGLTSGASYRVLRIEEKTTKFAGTQAWTLQNLDDTTEVTVWAPFSLTRYVMSPTGSLCSQKKTCMMGLKIIYNGFEGSDGTPAKYLFDFEEL